jgi:hypothetical protein
MRREREAEETRRRLEAANKAAEIWKAAQPAPDDHPYLTRKGVKAHGVRLHNGALAVPVLDGQEPGSDFEDSTVFCRVICQGSCSARNIYWQAFFYTGGFDEHRVSLQWPAQKDRISIFRAAVGVCGGGAMSGDFSLADVMVTTAPSILNLSDGFRLHLKIYVRANRQGRRVLIKRADLESFLLRSMIVIS